MLKNPTKKQLAKLCPREYQEQIDVATWLRARGFLFVHVPNESKSSFAYRATLKKMGLESGFPDIIIFDSPPDSLAKGVVMEIKRQFGGVLSKKQKDWLGALSARGWITMVREGADNAITAIKNVYRIK
jgi:hypothetical protein